MNILLNNSLLLNLILLLVIISISYYFYIKLININIDIRNTETEYKNINHDLLNKIELIDTNMKAALTNTNSKIVHIYSQINQIIGTIENNNHDSNSHDSNSHNSNSHDSNFNSNNLIDGKGKIEDIVEDEFELNNGGKSNSNDDTDSNDDPHSNDDTHSNEINVLSKQNIDLNNKSIKELRTILLQYNLPVSGNKTILVNRINNYKNQNFQINVN